RNVSADEHFLSDMLSTQMLLRTGGDPKMNGVQLLLTGGKDVMGAVCVAVLAAALAWLIIRRVSAWQASAAYAVTLCVLALIFPYDAVPRGMMPLYELLTGSAALVTVFLVGDILTAPHTASGRMIYGIVCAVLTVILRRTGSVEGGEVFALLLANAAASPIDRVVWSCRQKGISLSKAWAKAETYIRRRLRISNSGGIDLEELYGNAPLTGRSRGVYVKDEMRRAVDELYGKAADDIDSGEGEDDGSQV
ncbi:MAG: RnfABCDGE type electron transport complex subunit D, partial [Clostridia bacterium]|nr:RnfABCDGE type electron transport complex subunit D [Clostridia bacterium]